MSHSRGNPFERLLEQAARGLAGPLHPLEVLEHVRTAFDAAVSGDVAPNSIAVAFHPGDFDDYRAGLDVLRERIAALLASIEEARSLRRIGERVVAFTRSDAVPAGTVSVSARFIDTNQRSGTPPPAGATGRYLPETGLELVLGDGTRVAVTHTPFSIGRGPGNDLLLPGLSVSRRHAELVRSPRGYLLRDLGSRNGLLVGDARHGEVLMSAGTAVTLGEFSLELETSA